MNNTYIFFTCKSNKYDKARLYHCCCELARTRVMIIHDMKQTRDENIYRAAKSLEDVDAPL